MKGLKALLKVRGTYIGISAAILFQLIFFAVWLTAYMGVQDRTDQLSVSIVDEDGTGRLQLLCSKVFLFK